MRGGFPFLVIAAALVFFLGFPVEARAWYAYWDLGGGLGEALVANPYFGAKAPATLGYGLAYHATVAIRIYNKGLPIFFGVQHRALSLSTASTAFGLQATYPILRTQFGPIGLGLGATSLIWRESGLDKVPSYARSVGGYSFLAEIEYEMPITPEISFLLGAGTQWVKTAQGLGPAPAIDGTAVFRFFYWSQGEARTVSTHHANKGYRYPYGIELRK